jgi:hypothetical protein
MDTWFIGLGIARSTILTTMTGCSRQNDNANKPRRDNPYQPFSFDDFT